MENSGNDIYLSLVSAIPRHIGLNIGIEIAVVIILLFLSALFSGAEIAFFSLSPKQINDIKNSKSHRSRSILQLLDNPKKLLATLLIAINFVNIAIVIISSLITYQLLDFFVHPILGFFIQVVVVTFFIVFLGEITPKVYATQKAVQVAHLMALPLLLLNKILSPLSVPLVVSTNFIDKIALKKRYNISVDELTHAIDITSDSDTPEEEKKILKGIVRFGNIDVKQIMKSRSDVVAFDYKTNYADLLKKIMESGYSRIPVYEGNFDKVMGILYIKDILAYLNKDDDFNWQSLLRQPYFVPESKKINDLLKEFQKLKNHIAIVVDEYGGSSGIVTMEDILEEIVGEINDEFDDDELIFSKLDDNNYVFEGKTLLNDVCRVLEIDRKVFDVVEGEADTLAGLILELSEKIPEKNEQINFHNYRFTVESADKRRIKRVKISILKKSKESSSAENLTTD